MAIERVREAVRLRLEEIYEVESEYRKALSMVVIPFSEVFKKTSSSESNLKEIKIPFRKWDKEFKKILLKELY